MENIILTFSKLTNCQLYNILKLRQDVFIIEQNCIYSDIDNYDEKALHHIIMDGDQIISYARIFESGVKYESFSSIGRIIVHPTFRGKGFAKSLIKNSIEYCKEYFPAADIKIEAQAALKSYYNEFGFSEIGKIYPVDGIDHIEMIYRLKN